MHQLPDDSVQQITFSVTLPSEVETVGIGIGTEVEEHEMFSSRTVEGISGRAGQLGVHKVLSEPVVDERIYIHAVMLINLITRSLLCILIERQGSCYLFKKTKKNPMKFSSTFRSRKGKL